MTYHTTRVVRRLVNLIREWMRSEYQDPGKHSVEQMEDWVAAFIERRPGLDLAAAWQAADAVLRTAVRDAWPHLRGPTEEESAAAWAERTNRRLAERHPLFAAMGALEEVATLATPEGKLAQMHAQRETVRRLAEVGKREREERSARLVAEAHQRRSDDALSLNELLVWRHLYRIGAAPRVQEARGELLRLTEGETKSGRGRW